MQGKCPTRWNPKFNVSFTLLYYRTFREDIRGYRVEEWSDFTETVKKG